MDNITKAYQDAIKREELTPDRKKAISALKVKSRDAIAEEETRHAEALEALNTAEMSPEDTASAIENEDALHESNKVKNEEDAVASFENV